MPRCCRHHPLPHHPSRVGEEAGSKTEGSSGSGHALLLLRSMPAVWCVSADACASVESLAKILTANEVVDPPARHFQSAAERPEWSGERSERLTNNLVASKTETNKAKKHTTAISHIGSKKPRICQYQVSFFGDKRIEEYTRCERRGV